MSRSTRRAISRLPILRKDFIVDRYQLYESAVAGVDAILLIVAALDRARLVELLEAATAYDLDALVEVHTADEFQTVLDCGHFLVGVNNRNLSTFEVDMQTSFSIARRAPAGMLLVSESGIDSRNTIDELRAAGFGAVLVGESLMRAPRPGDALRALVA